MMNGSDENPTDDDQTEVVGDEAINEPNRASSSSSSSPEDQHDAFSQLQQSSVKLGSKIKDVSQEVDKKFGITQSLSQLGSKVQEVDQEHHVTENVSKSVAEVGSSLNSWWKTVDAACGISSATQKMSSAIMESVVDPAVPQIQRTWTATQQQWQQIDEQHQITTKTASALASGADFLTKTLDNHTGQQEQQQPPPNDPSQEAADRPNPEQSSN